MQTCIWLYFVVLTRMISHVSPNANKRTFTRTEATSIGPGWGVRTATPRVPGLESEKLRFTHTALSRVALNVAG